MWTCRRTCQIKVVEYLIASNDYVVGCLLSQESYHESYSIDLPPPNQTHCLFRRDSATNKECISR